MDANGTRYKLLLGRADWGGCLDGATELAALWGSPDRPPGGTDWVDDASELTLAALPWRFPEPAGAHPIPIVSRRGAAADRFGNWYWIDEAETGILVTSSGSGLTTPFWPAADGARGGSARGGPADRGRRSRRAGFEPLRQPGAPCAARLRGLAVTTDHYLLVGTLDPGGLLAFDLAKGGPPLQVEWPGDVRFEPLSIGVRPGGGAVVIEGPAGDRRGWRVDRHLMVEPLGPAVSAPAPPPTFGAIGPAAAAEPAPPSSSRVPSAILATDAMPLAGDPIDVAVLADDLVVVLDRRDGRRDAVIRRYDAGLRELPGSPQRLRGLPRTFVAHAMAAVPAGPAARGEAAAVADLYLVDELGDQAYRFPLGHRRGGLRASAEFHPMRLFGGRALVATPSGAWYDCVDRWVPLVAQQRPQYAESAVVETPILDSGLPGCTWHRVFLDACIPSEASIRIAAAAADSEDELRDGPDYREQPVPYRRGDGPERPYPTTPRDDRYGTYEILLQAARGRRLRLRITLTGNRRTTPRLRSLRAAFPRFSYLEHYLPQAYREDAASASFLDGFLANIEGTFTAIEDRIAAAQVLFDARSAPAETLDWLASWFDIVMDPGWDEDRRRLLLRHAVDLFRLRGTPRGLRIALGLATLACPGDDLFAAAGEGEPGGLRIVERYQAKRGPVTLFGDPTRAALPRESARDGRWTPGHGSTALHARYAAYLRRVADAGTVPPPGPADLRYPVRAPATSWEAAWRAFSGEVLGMVPSAGPGDTSRWRAFLERRYITPAAAAAAHRRLGAADLPSFDAVELPSSLPADGAPLADWYAFESIVMRGLQAAHRFSVLLPVPTGGDARRAVRTSDARERRAEQERVARLVDLEKPAHTVFDIRSYWLAFRVGEARLGKDTRVDLGSRSPDLYPPAVLGSMHLGEGVLTSPMADIARRTDG